MDVLREDRALQVAVRSSPLSITSESFGTTTAGSKSEHNTQSKVEWKDYNRKINCCAYWLSF